MSFTGLPSLSVAAHELKTPIALMRQLSLAYEDPDLPDHLRQAYSRSLTLTAERALRLVNDLAHVGNLSPSLFPLSPTNPMAVCQIASSLTSPMAAIYRRTITWPKIRKVQLVSANDRLLESVLVNFVDNALKYSEEGSEIVVALRRAGERIRLSVRDFGPAISLGEYRRLVNEMEQLKTVRTRPDSSGLGVFIANEFARAMGSTIGMIRHKDGVSFYIDLQPSKQMSLI